MKPLWNYQKNLRKPKNNCKHTSIYQQDNKTETHDEKQTLKRWTEWITQQFSQTQQESKNIQIDHIDEKTWEKLEQTKQYNNQDMHIPQRLQEIRKQSKLHIWQQQNPKITNLLIKDYTQNEVTSAIKTLKNNKAHGTDGIPAEAYKAIRTWITEPITHMLNAIKNGHELPKMEKKGQ